MRIYGQQQIELRVPFHPKALESSTPLLAATLAGYDAGRRIALVDVSGHDIHGEMGTISVKRPSTVS